MIASQNANPDAKPVYARHTDALEAVVTAVEASVSRGEVPHVVFDLDDTLFLVRPRKQAIFRELARGTGELALATALINLADTAIPYDVVDALATVGIEAPHQVAPIKSAFFDRFFNGDYTAHDEPNVGAATYVERLRQAGAKVVYLTGRPEEMQPRTLDTLAANGFPTCPITTDLILKSTAESVLGDAEFKGVKAQEIAARGPVLAAFDNEPANLNAMHAAMPEAHYFLLDTDHSPAPPPMAMAHHVMVDFATVAARLSASMAATPLMTGRTIQVVVAPAS